MSTGGAEQIATAGPPVEIEEEGLHAEALLAGQNRALELIAGNASLKDILTFLATFVESQAPDLFCSLLLLEDGRLRHGAAPSLPPAYSQAVEGLAIGATVGSCGTAAYIRKPVIVTDIENDPLWAPWREIPLVHGLRACWSTPIFSRQGEVLGTFALYYPTPRGPRPAELHLVELATHIAGIAIERHRADLALKQRAEALAEADRRKDEFLAMLAHELRNPLAPIVNALDLMSRHAADPRAVERYRGVVERQTRHLTRLVDDLLDVSRITRGKIALKLERVTVAAVVGRAVEASRPLLEQRRHDFVVDLPDEPIALHADPVRLSQVLSNLLNNAAKYTEPGGRISIRARRDGGEVEIAVKDTGIGIPEEMLPRIFDLFVQADRSLDRSQGGLGLGLTLVRSLAELHGGRVEARSEGVGRGSEILVRLPIAPPLPVAAAPVAPPPAPQVSAAPQRILVVDDNVDAAEMLAAAISASGDDVRVAHDGPSALTAARSFQPSVVLLDIGLPGLDGYEVARRLRAERPPRDLRLIAVTGYGQEGDRLRAVAAGFDAHLAKPVDLETVTAAIRG